MAHTRHATDETDGEQRLAQPPRVIVPRWVQLVGLPLAVVGVYLLVRASGRVVPIFLVAGLFALLLNPFVTLLRKARMPRGAAVALVLVVLVALLAGVVALLADPVSDQVVELQRSVPDLVDEANAHLADLQAWLDARGIDAQVKEPGRTALQTVGDSLSEGTGSIVSFTGDALALLVEGSITVFLTVVVCIYLLLYGERIGEHVRSIMPTGDGSPADDFPTRIQQAVLGYVRGQLLFSLTMGVGCGVMLWTLGTLGIYPDGARYALFFGIFFGVAELVPYVGPIIGGLPAGLGALFSDVPLDALWLFIAFMALQQLEGHVVAPNVFGHSLRINPLVVILALLLGDQLLGVLGALLALPIAAMLRESVIFLRRHLVLEPWPQVVAAATAAGGGELAGAGLGPDPPSCPECGARLGPDAAVCPACGTELAEPASAASAQATGPA